MPLRFRIPSRLVAPVHVALLAACGAADTAPVVVVRDSAGVEIVESQGGLWEDNAWTVSAEPTLVLGVLDGPEELQFTQVSGAHLLSDGRIVVANRNHPPEIRVFDPDGRHTVSFGRAGEGPGEFGLVWWTVLAGDTIIAFDIQNIRLSAFTTDGELLGTTPVAAMMDHPMTYVFWTRLADGYLLGTENRMVPADARGRGRAEMALLRFDPERRTPEPFIRVPGVEYDIQRPGELRTVLFGPRSAFHAHDDRFYVGHGDTFRIDVHDLDGRLLRSLRKHHDRRPVGQAERDAWLEDRLAGARTDDDRARIRDGAQRAVVAELMPAHGERMLVDPRGYLWVEGFHAPGDPARAWHVFDPAGRYLGAVEVPGTLRVTDIGVGSLLGVWRDEYHVESVRRYRIMGRPG